MTTLSTNGLGCGSAACARLLARRDNPEALVQLKDEVKRKNGVLEKYDAFYREVNAWSAEKGQQREPHSMNNITLI